jgi:hypothetical protein
MPQADWSAARCRSPMYPMVGNATGAPASSIRRPTIRTVRSLRRHTPSNWADGGNCSRPAARGCGGKSRSARVLHCAAAALPHSCIRDNSPAMNASQAHCYKDERVFAKFQRMEPLLGSNCATVWEISMVQMAVQQRFYGPGGLSALPFLHASIDRIIWRSVGPLPLVQA